MMRCGQELPVMIRVLLLSVAATAVTTASESRTVPGMSSSSGHPDLGDEEMGLREVIQHAHRHTAHTWWGRHRNSDECFACKRSWLLGRPPGPSPEARQAPICDPKTPAARALPVPGRSCSRESVLMGDS